MKTLTITEAKKNLGKWLNAAVQGDDVAIINGATFVALRPVAVEAMDYAWREYGASQEELAAFEKRVSAEVERLRRARRLTIVPNNLEDALEKIAGLKSHRAEKTPRAARQGKSRRSARVA